MQGRWAVADNLLSLGGVDVEATDHIHLHHTNCQTCCLIRTRISETLWYSVMRERQALPHSVPGSSPLATTTPIPTLLYSTRSSSRKNRRRSSGHCRSNRRLSQRE